MKKVFSSAKIAQEVTRIGAEITNFYNGKVSEENPLVVVVVMDGAFVFAADLVRTIPLPVQITFVKVSSYDNCTFSGQMNMDATGYLVGPHQNVLIVDDICDSGRTLNCVAHYLKECGAKVHSCVMLDKVANRVVLIAPTWWCLECPDKWVFGYGMDTGKRGIYRNLKEIYTEEEDVSNQ